MSEKCHRCGEPAHPTYTLTLGGKPKPCCEDCWCLAYQATTFCRWADLRGPYEDNSPRPTSAAGK